MENTGNSINKHIYEPDSEVMEKIKNKILNLGIDPNKKYFLRYPLNTSFCSCGSLMGDKCGTELPSDFYNLFDEDGNKIDSFKRKHWSYLKNMYNDEFEKIFMKNYDNPFQIEGNKIKIYIKQNEFVELTLTENPIIKTNYIQIEDKKLLRNFPLKEFSGKEILCIIYNNSKQFIKIVGGRERQLDIIIWKNWCDKINPNEWYSRLFISKKFLHIESNKKTYTLTFQDKKLVH